MLRQRTSIYIPSHLVSRYDVHDAIEAITREVGGCTIDDKRGAWVSPIHGLVYEHVSVYSWWHKPNEPAMQYVTTLARHLLLAGEEAVLIEFLREQGQTAVLATLKEGEVTW